MRVLRSSPAHCGQCGCEERFWREPSATLLQPQLISAQPEALHLGVQPGVPLVCPPQLGLEPIFTQSGQKLTCIFPVLFFSSEHLFFQTRVTRKCTLGVNPVEAWCHRTR